MRRRYRRIIFVAGGLAAVALPLGFLAAQQQASPPAPTVGLMQASPAPIPMPRASDDLRARGRAVVVGATGQDAANRPQPCFSCHGMKGAGDASGAFPRIAGQPAFYLYKQMLDYASGARPNDVMTPIAQALSQEDMEAVAAYYASQRDAETFPRPAGDALLIQRGGALSAVGSAEKGIQACVNCHGPTGSGLPPSIPYLAGQYETYAELQFRLWKDGVRKNDPLDVMADIARRMNDEDIKAVTAYFAQLPPPDVSARTPQAAPKAADTAR